MIGGHTPPFFPETRMSRRTSATHQALAIRPGGGPVVTRAQWPLASYLRLGALPTAVGCGRDHVRHVLAEWGLDALIDDAVLVISELLTNALQASQALPTPAPTPIALRLLANDGQLIIEAWDQWTESYKLQPPADDEHGRGLTVVSALSRRWGTDRVSQDYKAIWCELLIPRQ